MIGFIVNPISGNGRGAKVWTLLESILRQKKVPYHVRTTVASGDATRFAREMLTSGQYRIIVAVGGDGTVNETAEGFLQAKPPHSDLANSDKICALGYIPAGSGNDFARGHGISKKPEEALDTLLHALESEQLPEYTDLLRIGKRIATSSIGCGFDGQVAYTTNQASYKNWLNKLGLGKLAYIISVVRVLFTYKPRNMLIRIDCTLHEFKDAWLVAVGNLPFYGGGMKICPGAAPDDGLANICVVSKISRWKILLLFHLVFSGRHSTHPAVRMFSARSVEIIPDFPLAIQADGDLVDENRIYIEVLPGILPIIKPVKEAAGGGRTLMTDALMRNEIRVNSSEDSCFRNDQTA